MGNITQNFFSVNIESIVQRFFLPVFFLCISTALVVLEIHNFDVFGDDGDFIRVLMTLGLGFVFGVSLKIFFESHRNKYAILAKCGLSDVLILVVAGVVGVSLFMIKAYLWSYVFLLSGVLISLMYAPYVLKDTDDADCCHFNSVLGVNIFFAIVSTLILCGGLSLILASIDYLFGVNIHRRFYQDIWSIGGMLFAPLYVLSNMPTHYNFSTQEQYIYPKGIQFIVSYLLTPLLCAYTLILYAYMVYIAVQGELPKGRLAYMITGYGVIGVATHLLVYSLRETGHVLVRFVSKYFYHALLVPVALMGLAIWERVNAYGITESRYAVIMAVLWLGGTALYIVVSRTEKLKIVPVGISVLFVLASFGPWSASNVSFHSQFSRLGTLLTEHKLLQEGQIVKGRDEDVPFAVQKSMSSILDFLGERQRLSVIKPWFPETAYLNRLEEPKRHRHYYSREKSRQIMKDMGLTYISKWQREESYKKNKKKFRYNIYVPPHLQTSVKDVRAFDYILSIRGLHAGKEAVYTLEDKQEFKITLENNELTLQFGTDDMIVMDMKYLMAAYDLRQDTKAPLTLKRENADLSVMLSLINVSGDKDDAGTRLVTYLQGSLYVDIIGE